MTLYSSLIFIDPRHGLCRLRDRPSGCSSYPDPSIFIKTVSFPIYEKLRSPHRSLPPSSPLLPPVPLPPQSDVSYHPLLPLKFINTNSFLRRWVIWCDGCGQSRGALAWGRNNRGDTREVVCGRPGGSHDHQHDHSRLVGPVICYSCMVPWRG